MILEMTHWPSRTATIGGRVAWPWATLCAWAARPVVAASKGSLPAWSAATFGGDRRLDELVEQVTALVLDHDDGSTTLDASTHLWEGTLAMVHTSFRHAPEAPRLRVVLPLSRPVEPREYERVWLWARARCQAAGQILDATTRNPGRIWFVPARAPGGVYDLRRLEGRPLDVDAILSLPFTAPSAVSAGQRGIGSAGVAAHGGVAGPDLSRSGRDAHLAITLVRLGASDDEIARTLAIESAKFAEKLDQGERAAEVYLRRTVGWARGRHSRGMVRAMVRAAALEVLPAKPSAGKPALARLRLELDTSDGQSVSARMVVPSPGYEHVRRTFHAVAPDLSPAGLLSAGGGALASSMVGRQLDVVLRDGRVVWMQAHSR